MAAFTTQKLVRFQHCDPAGIVFYPQYFLLFNEVVEDWFAQGLGVDFRRFHLDEKRGVPVRKTTAEFLAPSLIGDVLDCALTVNKVGASSIDLVIRVTCQGELRAEVNHLLVQVSNVAKKAIPFEEAMRARIASFAA
jgi:4-hydroxybenzoyl-CoA thioesterase